MDTVRLDLREHVAGSWRTSLLVLRINGTLLADYAREVELPFATAEGHLGLAGDYGPLTLDQIEHNRMHFLGSPVVSWFEDGDTVLLGCASCGDWGCWLLTARVEVESDVVMWSGFRLGHRSWDLSALGPFVFDRAQYEAAFCAIT